MDLGMGLSIPFFFMKPAVGKIEMEKVNVNFWDLGGQQELHSIWEKYYRDAHAVIFVVDSTDEARIDAVQSAFGTHSEWSYHFGGQRFIPTGSAYFPKSRPLANVYVVVFLGEFRQSRYERCSGRFTDFDVGQ
jgi:GTPase SAR1 family protein